ncbi:MAG: Gx transporter family protein [Oscillospiraceae bacterium]|nr:Gx transporter family protein [Oscillospiraceae bacterium]
MSDRKTLMRRLTLIAALSALGAAVGALERPLMALIPLPLPGFKLGLANLTVLFTAYRLRRRDAFLVMGIRVALVNLAFGTPVSLALALSGGLCSAAVTAAFCRSRTLSPVGVSCAASAAHMAGQIAMAAVILSTPALFLSYLPWLLLLSIPTGLLNGALSIPLIRRVPARLTAFPAAPKP